MIWLFSLIYFCFENNLFSGDFGKKKTDVDVLINKKINVKENFSGKLSYYDDKKNLQKRTLFNLNFDDNNLFLSGKDLGGATITIGLKDIDKVEVIDPLKSPNPRTASTTLSEIKILTKKASGLIDVSLDIEGKTLVRGVLSGTTESTFAIELCRVKSIEVFDKPVLSNEKKKIKKINKFMNSLNQQQSDQVNQAEKNIKKRGIFTKLSNMLDNVFGQKNENDESSK